MLLSVRTWAPCYGGHGDASCLYIAGLSAVGGQGNASLCTCLDTLVLEVRETLLSVHAWTLSYWRTGKSVRVFTLCWWRMGKCFYLYVPRLSVDGGHGDGSLCTYLYSLLAEGTELLLSVRTWTLCWQRTRNCFSVGTWTHCW